MSSIWGPGDPATIKLLQTEAIRGTWLNLAAGDGRYNSLLLAKADHVVAVDIDSEALHILQSTSEKTTLSTQIVDITKPFPFPSNSFDGIFCAGTLHLFPPHQLQVIVTEMKNVLKPGGKIIVDFATNVKRILPNGTLYLYPHEQGYTAQEGNMLLEKLFADFKISLTTSHVSNEFSHNLHYKFSCDFLLLVARKH